MEYFPYLTSNRGGVGENVSVLVSNVYIYNPMDGSLVARVGNLDVHKGIVLPREIAIVAAPV